MRNCILFLTAFILCFLFPLSSNSQMSSKSYQARKLPDTLGQNSSKTGKAASNPTPTPTPVAAPSPISTPATPASNSTPTPSPTPVKTKGEVNCQYFVDTKFSKNHTMSPTELGYWRSCINDLSIDIPDPSDGSTTTDKALSTLKDNYKISTADEVDVQLITTHFLIRQLKRWGKPCSDAKASSDAASPADTKASSGTTPPANTNTSNSTNDSGATKNSDKTNLAAKTCSNDKTGGKPATDSNACPDTPPDTSTTKSDDNSPVTKTCNDGITSDCLTRLARIESSLKTFMDYTGLSDPFAGSLIAGPVFGDTGKLSPGTTSTASSVAIRATTTSATGGTAASSQSNTNTLAHVEWSSKHFGPEWSHFDFSFGGSFGLQPALSLLTNPPAASSTATPTPTPAATPANSATTSQFQSAFVWTLNGRTNYQVGTTSEASGYVRVGQLRLLSGNGATIIDQGANSTLQIPLNSNADRMSWFYETGIEYNFYNKSLEIVHEDKGQLQPAFNIGIAYKHDSRFSQSAGVVGFDSPEQRLVFRFLINGLKIIDRRPDTTTSKPYAVSFGVEHERGFGANPVPSGTQLIIRGDINLLKLINP